MAKEMKITSLDDFKTPVRKGINEVYVKSILNKHKKRDSWFLLDYSINPYLGCSFNCLYCYIRGSHYGGDTTHKLQVKANAAEILKKQLKRRAKNGEYGLIGIASATEPYPEIEKELKLTRELLQIIARFKFPVSILTRSTLVLRDMDILKKINENAILPPDLKFKLRGGAIISFSFSTPDEKLAKIFEPNAPKPKERLETMKKFKDHGFRTGVCFMPVLPFLSDSEKQIEKMIVLAKNYGSDSILTAGLTLFGDKPTDCKTVYYKTLEKHFPELLEKTKKLFGQNFYPNPKYQRKLTERANAICKKYEIKNRIV
ncbi:SPL family radical SAM protein [Methanobacterium oryzae]|uniref:SPL family radical SAM protein n=1 Tax=Methanobacterium oryzae TaxID=69540 RepID=UPI003D1AF0BE